MLESHRQFAGDLVGARSCYEQTLEACREIGEGKEIAGALSNLAKNDLLLGNHETARLHLQEALALFRAEGDSLAVAWCLNHLADVAAATNDSAEADRLYLESEAMFRSTGDAWASRAVQRTAGISQWREVISMKRVRVSSTR